MKAAITRARRGVGRVAPASAVAALVVDDGQRVAIAHRATADAPHPALTVAVRGTLYVTSSPPSSAAARLAGYDRVVIGADDPVHGRKSVAALKRRGVDITRGVLADRCRQMDEAFFFAAENGRPFVVLKSAATFDGRIATNTGESQWITGPEARRHGHRLRDRLDAIVVGINTVQADDPLLTARVRGGYNPVRVVLDSKLRIPITARLVQTARDIRTIVATTRGAPPAKRRALKASGVDVWVVKKDRQGHVDVGALLERLHADGRLGVLVEGGARVAGSFVDRGLIDKLHLFLAPKMLGAGAAAVNGQGVGRLADALRFEHTTVRRVGEDLLLTAYTARDGAR